jgi:UDP-N-acetylmuramoyl-tripeptide--D-alanyl-D-alanine ligase
VIPGSLFVAIPGEKADGHDFIGEAFKRGASFALIQRDVDASFRTLRPARRLPRNLTAARPELAFCACAWTIPSPPCRQIARFWRRKLNLRVVGITGSVGKSTTKEMVAEVLGTRFRTLKSPGNLNNEIGLPLTVLAPQRGLRTRRARNGILRAGRNSFLCDIAQPQVGVVTNMGTVHAERAGSQEAIARAKRIVQALPPAPEGVAILNFDDPWVRKMEEKTKARVFFYGLSPEAHLWADQVEGLGWTASAFACITGETLHAHPDDRAAFGAYRVARRGGRLGEGLNWQEILRRLEPGSYAIAACGSAQ